MKILMFMFLILSSQMVWGQTDTDKTERELIGEVHGQPIYRDQLKSTEPSELSRLFLKPLWEKYARKHQDELQVTPEEIDAFRKNLIQDQKNRLEKVLAQRKEVEKKLEQNNLTKAQKQELKRKYETLTRRYKKLVELLENPLNWKFSSFYLNIWKGERHLYLNYGKGKVIYQQIGGYEALDARRNWIKKQRQKGAFQITDPKLRKKFDEYYKNRDGVAVPKENMDRFLNPDWLKSSQEKKSNKESNKEKSN